MIRVRVYPIRPNAARFLPDASFELTRLYFVTLADVRLSEFRQLVLDEFGQGYGPSVLRDHVLADLGNRTAEQAITAGESPKKVWWALCADFEVPPERLWGRDR